MLSDGVRVPVDTSERCRRIGTATWSDALDSLRVNGVMDGLGIRSRSGRIAGPAVTVQERIASLGKHEFGDFDVGGIIRSTTPGSVAVIAMNGEAVSTFGGLAARAAADQEIAAVIIDGGCRDLAEIQASGIFLASRHVTPRSGKGRVKVVGVGGVVTCGGVEVHQGDYVIADETGVVVVPRHMLADALALAEKLDGKDRSFEQELAAGVEFGSIAARLGHL